MHNELQADINYIVPASLSVAFPALDFFPTNLPLMLFLEKLEYNSLCLSNASATFGKYTMFHRN